MKKLIIAGLFLLCLGTARAEACYSAAEFEADAAATGHFLIGSGTRLAFDSAIALADFLHSEPTMEAAFERYQEERRMEVLRLPAMLPAIAAHTDTNGRRV